VRPLHERMVETVAGEGARLSSRRRFLGGGAVLAGGGALALVAVGAPGRQRAAAQDFTDDLDVLNYALTLEHLEHAFYRDGLEEFDEDDFAALFPDGEEVAATAEDDATPEAVGGPGQAAAVRAALEEVRDHEAAHVEALTEAITQLGGTPVAEGEYDFGYDDLEGFLEVAQALENTGVAAYAGAAPAIADPTLLATALGIHSVEARHAAYLNLQNGDSPFPEAFDEALTRAEVLEIVGQYIVAVGGAAATATVGAGAPTVTSGVDVTEEPDVTPPPIPTEEPAEPPPPAPPPPTEAPAPPPAPPPTEEPVPTEEPEPTPEPEPEPTLEPVEPRTPDPREPDPRTPAGG
jgi:Ferritin-like domain